MNHLADIIIELESNNSRNFKEDILVREMKANNHDFFTGIMLACDKLITFGLSDKSIPKADNSDNIVNDLEFTEFLEVVQSFINRELTGNTAKQMILSMIDRCSNHVWNNWYRRILLKDLKCGVDVKTVNNCAKKLKLDTFLVPLFSCQLAQNHADHEKKMVGNKHLQIKLDGVRLLSVVYPDGKVDQFARNGKEMINFTAIKEQLSNAVKTFGLNEPVVFDGEIMSSSFQDLMKQVYRKDNIQTQDSVLYIFDMIPLADFVTGVCQTPLCIRNAHLNNWYEQNKELIPNVNTLVTEEVNLDTDAGWDRLKYFNKLAITNGYEGIMIKDPESPYECKRSASWLKMKPVMTYDLEIIDVQEGTDKYTGMLGAFVCRGMEDGKEIFTNVGSGLTEEQRKEYWDNRSNIIGRIIEVKCDVITQNQNGTYSLRFPVFMRMRGFDKGEKL